jgi:hypothetical protein
MALFVESSLFFSAKFGCVIGCPWGSLFTYNHQWNVFFIQVTGTSFYNKTMKNVFKITMEMKLAKT